MTFSFPDCPKAIKDSLTTLSLNMRSLANLPTTRLTPSDAHEVYYIAARDLVEQQSLSAAKRVAWRMTHTGVKRVVAAEIDVSVRPDNTEVTSFNEGPFAAEPATQLKALRRSSTSGAFEVRILRIPEVYLMAIWLHSEAFDLGVPLHPAPPGLLAGQEYSVRGLAAALLSAVRQLLHQDSDLDG